MTSKLDELREELGELDREILRLVAKRQETALTIGEIKRKAGNSTRDFQQEARVIGRARQRANELELDPKIAEEITSALIRGSLTAQEQDRVEQVGGGEGKRALLIGGAGKMGQWFARFLSSQGYSVEISDPCLEESKPWQEMSLDHDIVVVAATLASSAEILNELAEKKPTGTVFDIGSLKSPLREGLQKCAAKGLRITSIHPMFGPSTRLLSGQHVIICDLGCAEANEDASNLFAATMATRVDMNIESHDRLIAYVLGLSHALNLAFVTALAESGESAPTLSTLSSTTFNAQLGVASAVAGESPHLYFEIQNLNDYGTEALSALLYAVERIRSQVRAGDQEAFVKLMTQANAYLQSRNLYTAE